MMVRCRILWALLILALPSAASAESKMKAGFWQLNIVNGANETPQLIIQLEEKEGKFEAKVTKSVGKAEFTVKSLEVKGDTAKIVIHNGGFPIALDMKLDAKDEKLALGSIMLDTRPLNRATLRLGGEEITPAKPAEVPESMKSYMAMTAKSTAMINKIRQTMDANERADLQKQFTDLQKELEEKAPGYLTETIQKHANSPYAIAAATNVLASAARMKPTKEDVEASWKIIATDAKNYGPSLVIEAAATMATNLSNGEAYREMAVKIASEGFAMVKGTEPIHVQARSAKALVRTQKALGKTDAKAVAALDKLETALDAEYNKNVPPFKPEKFAGRKEGTNRVAVMELFTGAECPPCVAADVAFDALIKAYQPSELVLIQYHVHIPGPDPLTNKDSLDRYKYYSEKNPKVFGGTPSILFNGAVKVRGGGSMAMSEGKFKAYKEVVDPIIAEKIETTINGDIARNGDKVTLKVDIDNIKDPGEKVKVRFIITEENIRYVGGNGLRFHHHVVRGMPEGPGGIELKEKSFKKEIVVDLEASKKACADYLDTYMKGNPLAASRISDKPLEMKNLKLIALIQNDETGEVITAKQFSVPGK